MEIMNSVKLEGEEMSKTYICTQCYRTVFHGHATLAPKKCGKCCRQNRGAK